MIDDLLLLETEIVRDGDDRKSALRLEGVRHVTCPRMLAVVFVSVVAQGIARDIVDP